MVSTEPVPGEPSGSAGPSPAISPIVSGPDHFFESTCGNKYWRFLSRYRFFLPHPTHIPTEPIPPHPPLHPPLLLQPLIAGGEKRFAALSPYSPSTPQHPLPHSGAERNGGRTGGVNVAAYWRNQVCPFALHRFISPPHALSMP